MSLASENLPTKLARSFDCRQGTVRSVRFNVDGNYCITAGNDKTIKLWNPHRQIHLKTYTGLGAEALDACGASDNSSIIAGGRDGQPTLFDVESGKMLKRWRDHGGPINAVAFNEDSSLVISASQDCTIQLHDVRSRGPPVQTLDEATDAVLSVDVGTYEIASGSADGHARIYDIREGRLFVDFMGDSVTDVRITADNQCLLVAAMHSPLRLIEKCNGQLLADYVGHRNDDYRIECDMMSSNNEVVSGSEDGFIYVWDMVDSKKILARLEHPGVKFVSSLTTHPTKQILLSAAAQRCFYWQNIAASEE